MNTSRRLAATISIFAILILMVASCSSKSSGDKESSTDAGGVQAAGSPSTSPEVENGTHITTTIADMSINMSTHTAPAGPVTFDITNNGPSLHELVVLKTNLPLGQIPPDPAEAGKVYEDGHGVTHIGEDGNIPANTSATLTINLKPGKYQIICNLPGHYAAGMYTDLTVTASGASPSPVPPAAPDVESGTHVTATLADMSVTLSTNTVPAGNVTFDITNNGPSLHELVVLKTDTALGQIPANPDEPGQVYEDGHGVTHIGENGNIPPNTSAALTLKLKPGKYQIVCNLPGHYAAGMYAALTVTG